MNKDEKMGASDEVYHREHLQAEVLVDQDAEVGLPVEAENTTEVMTNPEHPIKEKNI